MFANSVKLRMISSGRLRTEAKNVRWLVLCQKLCYSLAAAQITADKP